MSCWLSRNTIVDFTQDIQDCDYCIIDYSFAGIICHCIILHMYIIILVVSRLLCGILI